MAKLNPFRVPGDVTCKLCGNIRITDNVAHPWVRCPHCGDASLQIEALINCQKCKGKYCVEDASKGLVCPMCNFDPQWQYFHEGAKQDPPTTKQLPDRRSSASGLKTWARLINNEDLQRVAKAAGILEPNASVDEIEARVKALVDGHSPELEKTKADFLAWKERAIYFEIRSARLSDQLGDAERELKKTQIERDKWELAFHRAETALNRLLRTAK